MFATIFNTMFSQSEENYLKAIYHLSKGKKNGVSTNDIATKLATKPSSVSDMIKKLSEKDLISYKKYYGVNLTDSGKKIACTVIRKHRLWEVFLVEKLNFSWDEVHDVAEQLEHIQSSKLIDELDALLGFPTHDPHGDPIPDKNGNYSIIEKVLLSSLHKDEKGLCVGVKDSSTEFLKYLDKKGFVIGETIQVVEKEEYDDSFVVLLKNNRVSISYKIANNLFVKKI